MTNKTKTVQVSPYDLAAIRRNSRVVPVKTGAPAIREPYTLASSQRLSKSTVLLRAKRTA